MLSMREVVSQGSQAPAGDGAAAPPVGAVVTLTFEQRRRSRLLVHLDDGREGALLLPHGTHLRDGQRLRVDGEPWVVAVRAAAESLSVARAGDPRLLARAAYHLGNRHVALEIGPDFLAYEHDHVLDAMVRELGLEVDTRIAPFEPEAGGYRHDGAAPPAGADGGHGHAHGHNRGHGRSNHHHSRDR